MNCFEKSEVRSQKSEVRNQKSEVRIQKDSGSKTNAFFFLSSFRRVSLSPILLVLFLIFHPSAVAGDGTVIKFATLAPKGSTWMKVMDAFGKEVSEKTSGAVKFKIYAGGVSGDEKDVIRKIRLGQLQAGGFTGVGLGEIAPEVRILDAPFLFKNQGEIDHVYKAFDNEFRKALEDKGYVLLGWAEVGFVNIFTNVPVHSPEDLRSVKMWMWEGDPIAEAAYRAIGISPVPLSITDVMTSVQTGLVNGVYGSPLSVLALQWFTRTKFMFSLPIANASGAVLISKKTFDRLAPDLRKILIASGEKHFRTLTSLSRKDNEKSVSVLKKEGITVTEPASRKVVAEFEAMGTAARKSLVGRLYSAELLARVEKALSDYRSPGKAGK
ncbi:MAG: TRAP transporter substrate-binding protein DctP [bacterium]